MDLKALKDAIKMRKGQGVDIKLIIGGGEEDEMEDKESDLAPEVKDGKMRQPMEGEEELMAQGEEMPEGEEDVLAMGDGMDEKEKAMLQMKKEQDGYGGGSLLKKAMAMMGKK